MNQELENLIKLQEIDIRIHELVQSKKDLPEAVGKLEGEIQSAQESVSQIEKGLEKTEADRKAAQEAIGEADKNLNRSQERLNAISTNREYDAVHTEIENAKNAIVAGQVKLKKTGDETTQLESRRSEAQEQLQTVKTENDPKITELKEKIANLDSNIASVEQERAQVIPTISKQFYSTYEYIRKRRKNARALGFVGQTHTCSVCHKILEPRLIAELRRGNKLPSCQSCGSLLIWSDEHAAESRTE